MDFETLFTFNATNVLGISWFRQLLRPDSRT